MWFFRLLGSILLVTVAIGIAGAIFQAGYVAGTAGSAGVVGPWYGWPAFGWGFGGFNLLGTLIALFVFIALARFVFGGGSRRHGYRHDEHGWGPGNGGDRLHFGGWEGRARDRHDEWHRQNDSSASSGSANAGSSTGTATPGADHAGSDRG